MAQFPKFAFAALATSALVPAAALAQSVPDDALSDAAVSEEQVAGEILVTARRKSERLLDAPVAITAVGGETLAQYQVARVSDLATLVPSMVAGRAASGSSASIFLRGVGSTALSAGFDQSVSFVIDGIALSRGREISLPQFDIQQVEVLKGPQALFFGKGTTGGLISISSNNPTDRFEAGVKAGYGFEARDKYVEGYVSGPISDNLRLRLAGRYADSDGAFTNTAADTYTNYIPGQVRTRISNRRGFSESYGLRGTADWDVSPNFTLQLKAGMSGVDDGGSTDLVERVCGSGRTTPLSSATPLGVFPPSPNADCRVNGRSDLSAIPLVVAQTNYRYARNGEIYADFKSQFAVLTGNITSDPFDVTSITAYYRQKQVDLNVVSGEAYPATFTQNVEYQQLSQELRFQSKFDGPFNLMFGGFYVNGDLDFNTDAYIFPVPLVPGTTNTFVTFKRDNGFNSDSLSFFAEGTFSLTSQLELSAGARYSVEARDSFQRSLPAHVFFAAAFPGGVALSDRYRDTDLSPQATIRYKPTEDTTLYAAYKQGYKAGGFNISQGLSSAPIASQVAAGRFGEETAEGGEIGLRTLLLDRRLIFNVTAYRYEYSDLQVQFFDPVTISQVASNAGKLTTQGIEADFNYRLPGLNGLSFRGSAAFNDAKFSDYIGACYPGQTITLGCNLTFARGVFNSQDYEDRTPPKAPRFAGRLGATYETALTDSGIDLRMTGDVGYTSKYNYSDALRPDAVQPSFTRVDASISVSGRDQAWTLSLIGRNLTNELVITAANDIPFAGGTGTGTPGPGVTADMSAFIDNPREFFVELAFKF